MPVKVLFKSANNKLSDSDPHALGLAAFRLLDCNSAKPRKNSSGRPFVDGGYCSIAHTDVAGAAAISLLPIGIDIEKIRNRNSYLLECISHPQERDIFQSLGRESVVAIWVIKEAVAKASGVPIWDPLRFLISGVENEFMVSVFESFWAVRLDRIQDHFIGVAVPWGTSIPVVDSTTAIDS